MKLLEQIITERYQIQSHLAQGGMADVYLAYDIRTQQTVAIKAVDESADEHCKPFQLEVKVMTGLAHKHILPVLDSGKYESWYFMVTPYIEYGTLTTRLADGPLSLEEAGPILSQLAEALQFAHSRDIVHRDIKPSNILMQDGNHVYLADFGLAKRIGQAAVLTLNGHLIGTPEYMAPELISQGATPQSDVYSLGVLLYRMLAGRVPFKASTPMGVYLCHLRDLPEPPTTFNPTIPAEVEHVILHSIEKDPLQRYQSTQELYQAYHEAVQSVIARHADIVDQVMRAPTIRLSDVAIRIVKRKSNPRKPLLAVTFLIGIFVMLCFRFFSGGWDKHTTIVQNRAPSMLSSSMRITSKPFITPTPLII